MCSLTSHSKELGPCGQDRQTTPLLVGGTTLKEGSTAYTGATELHQQHLSAQWKVLFITPIHGCTGGFLCLCVISLFVWDSYTLCSSGCPRTHWWPRLASKPQVYRHKPQDLPFLGTDTFFLNFSVIFPCIADGSYGLCVSSLYWWTLCLFPVFGYFKRFLWETFCLFYLLIHSFTFVALMHGYPFPYNVQDKAEWGWALLADLGLRRLQMAHQRLPIKLTLRIYEWYIKILEPQ